MTRKEAESHEPYEWAGNVPGQHWCTIRVGVEGVTYGGGPPFGEWGGQCTLADFLDREVHRLSDFPSGVIADAIERARALLSGAKSQ